jgi:ribosomal protein S18 acetylase RimI-like enzyme
MDNTDSSDHKVGIREFETEDYDDVMKLWRESKLPHKPHGRDRRDRIAREIVQSNAIFLIAEKDGVLIGSAFGTHDGRKGWINRVAVAPKYRRQGIAEELVRQVEHRLHDMGIRIIACLIEDWNEESMEFFERIGYKRHHDIFYFTKREGIET